MARMQASNFGAGGGGASVPSKETKTGTNLSGSDGERSRALTLSTTPTEVLVIVERKMLLETTDYTVSTDTVTFVNQMFDADKIEVIKFV